MSLFKKYWNNKMKAFVWGFAGLLLLIMLIAAVNISGNDLCKTIVVNITGNAQQYFITEKNVLNTVNAANALKNKTKADINLKEIEDKLLQNIWVDKADVFFSDKNTLQIDVLQREPLYRLFTLGGQSYYVDKANKILPLSDNFSAKLPVFTGYKYSVSGTSGDSGLLAPITKMATYIANDEFWRAQIQQVEIVKNDFELVPTVGEHIILFGDTAGMHKKFEKLKKYYAKVASVIGFDRFKYLNIQFKDQVVGTNNYVNITDSINVKRNVQRLLDNNGDTISNAIDTAVVTRNNNRSASTTPTTTSSNTTRLATPPAARPSATTTQAVRVRPVTATARPAPPNRPAAARRNPTPTRTTTNNNRNRTIN